MNSKRVQVHSSAAATSLCRAVSAAAATATATTDNNSRFVSSLIIMIHT